MGKRTGFGATAAPGASRKVATTKTHKAATSNTALAESVAKKAIVEWMDQHPGQVVQLWAQLEAGLLASANRQTGNQDTWPETYIYWRQIPKYYFASVLSAAGEKHGLSAALLDEIDGKDREAFRRTVQLMCGVNQHHKIPKALFHKACMTSWLKERLEKLGSRHKTFAKGVSPNFVVDWAKVGAFTFAKNAGGKVSVLHGVLGSVSLPQQLNFQNGSGWQIIDNHDDDQARIDCGITQVYLKNLYQSGEQHKSYWALFTAKGQKETAEQVKASVDEQAHLVPQEQPGLLTKAKAMTAVARKAAASANLKKRPKHGADIVLQAAAVASAPSSGVQATT